MGKTVSWNGHKPNKHLLQFNLQGFVSIPNMYRLIYISSASSLYSADQLEDILTASRRNNERLGITGILLYHDGSIVQVLEGDELNVTNCYHRILLDKRHGGAMTIMEGPCKERFFEEWSMGFKKVSDTQWETLSGYFPITASSVKFANESSSGNDMTTFIRSFCHSSFKF
jgi:hypothetical protein